MSPSPTTSKNSPEETRHEIGLYIDNEGFFAGCCGEVLIDEKWLSVWVFRSEAQAKHFIESWGGFFIDTQTKVSEQRFEEVGIGE
jgi:hypothetical protein